MTVYHLVGQQPVPAYLSAIQPELRGANHFLISTERFMSVANSIGKTLRGHGVSAKTFSFGDEAAASDFTALSDKFSTLLKETNPNNDDVVFDITGGTKPMAISALLIGRKMWPFQIRHVYLDFSKKCLFYLNTLHEEPLTERMTLDDFIALSGKASTRKNTTEITEELRTAAFRNRKFIVRIQGKMAEAEKKGKTVFDQAYAEFTALLAEEARTKWESEFGKVFSKLKWTAAASYLAGGWFEDYTCSVLRKAHPELECRRNISIRWKDDRLEAQEFDIAYTDGFSFYIVECKAGNVKQDHFQKLENLRSNFSGAQGKCALVTLKPSEQSRNVHLAKRIGESKGIAAFCGNNGLQLFGKHALDFAPGKIYE